MNCLTSSAKVNHHFLLLQMAHTIPAELLPRRHSSKRQNLSPKDPSSSTIFVWRHLLPLRAAAIITKCWQQTITQPKSYAEMTIVPA